ncbi:universal stress protein family domain containing protein [Niveomyces insectorum RCEF 264]|uniref:Universal stress protein family domain containing protein n=1 Tax=Niveomyces insectorum RCEF 264 TaxID=1081102 RepID=A0A167Z4I4_9HYPO|nr:universal stress protein family domain containing protein [Niveomyces insectorum RCEF 264]
MSKSSASPRVSASETDRSPGSDVSPMTQVPVKTATAKKTPEGYFTPPLPASNPSPTTAASSQADARTEAASETASSSAGSVLAFTPATGATGANADAAHAGPGLTFDLAVDESGRGASRKSSAASVSFRPPRNPALPQGQPKRGRIRSPSPQRFRRHVGFDNIPIGEATKSNTLSYSLSISHYGYHPRRRSRTLMVGIDHHVYSDFALQWLLEEYADDGDEVICVHVVDRDARTVEEKNYKTRAQNMVERIKSKIPEHCAISVKLEYAVGKLHATFQKLIQVYQPSMLVVGTRGRSLGGFQSLVNTNSFSKYCLQYSPVPTVVVRDYEKRKKKKDKRTNDPSRHSYAAMLAATHGVHEANSESSSLYNVEARISPDEEAHQVAVAIGLPAALDPTLKPLDVDRVLGRHSRTTSPAPVAPHNTTISEAPLVLTTPVAATAASVDSDEEDSAEDEEPEFETMTGQQALQVADKETEKEQKKRLHEMEVGEADALRHTVKIDEDDDENETNESNSGSGNGNGNGSGSGEAKA